MDATDFWTVQHHHPPTFHEIVDSSCCFSHFVNPKKGFKDWYKKEIIFGSKILRHTKKNGTL